MKTVLIVDDDASALRALARVITVRYRGVGVMTAGSCEAAIEALTRHQIDLVLADLGLRELEGFALLGWMMANTPHVQVAAMTHDLTPDLERRLGELGELECLKKPIALDVLAHLLDAAPTSEICGQLSNVGLPSLLQLIEMERKTCRMVVQSDARVGTLQIVCGQLVHAVVGELEGDEAALEIASWERPTVEFVSQAPPRQRSVSQPLGFILMEAARLQDEREWVESERMALEESGLPRAVVFRGQPAGRSSARAFSQRSLRAAMNLDGVLAVALVTFEGCVLDHLTTEHVANLEAVAGGMADVLRAELATIAQQARAERVEDVMITTGARYELLRLLPGTEAFALVIGDRQRAAPAMTRLLISATERQLSESARALLEAPAEERVDAEDFDLSF